MPEPETLDNTPHPRILSMLGEIKFAPWQCIAELIDNAIDGFLEMKRLGTPIADPTITVAVGRETVMVKDNGPGMNFELLEKAVRAGWSGQENVNSLGLYGMGFNIATAVLGQVTTIQTTRINDESFFETEIDLKNKEYGLPRRLIPKTDYLLSGTKVTISKIKHDHRSNLEKDSWIRQHITERLRRVYSTMLRDVHAKPLKFTLIINNKKVIPWEYCTWPQEWEVFRKTIGSVCPITEIDANYGTLYRNSRTGETYSSPDEIPEEYLVTLPQRIYGWIGIQRYCDDKEYGFDLIRNGRKIELNAKDFFTWEGDDLRTQLEYPIDDVRKISGRIVGELHVDHGKVYYMKDHFERGHISWEHLDKAVRNAEPLTKRGDHGLEGHNESPLGTLFRTFRRNSPGPGQTWWDILCFKENDVAKAWADEWRKGNPQYLKDSLWLQKLESYSLPDSSPDDNPESEEELEPDPIIDGGTQPGDRTAPAIETVLPEPEQIKQPITELNLSIQNIGSTGASYEVEVFSRLDEDDTPWYSTATARGVYEIYINTNHPVFNSTTLQYRDAVLTEMAHIIANEEAEQTLIGSASSFSTVLTALRNRFSHNDSLDLASLIKDAETARKTIVSRLALSYNLDRQTELISMLPAQDTEAIRLAAAQGTVQISPVEYLSLRNLATLLTISPEALFEARCFNRLWTPDILSNDQSLLESHRKKLVTVVSPLISVLGDFVTQSQPEPSKSYLSYIRATIARLNEFLTG